MASQLIDFFNRLRGRGAKGASLTKASDHLLTHSDMELFTTFFNNLLPDPDEVLAKAGLTASTYYQVMTDAHVAGSVKQRKSRVKRMDMVTVVGKDKNGKVTPQGEAALDLIKEQIANIERIPEVINEILDAPYYGATYLELFWNRLPISTDRPNGQIVLTDIMAKPFEWFAYDVDNVLKTKSEDTPFGFTLNPIPPNKILSVVQDGTYRNPYGERAFKSIFWPFQFKKGGLRFWTEFLEKYGMPFLHGQLDLKTTSNDDLTQFHNDLVDMVRNGVLVSRSSGKKTVDVVESKSRSASSDAHKAYKNAMNIEISKGILGETLTIENSETGSQAATETHLEVLYALQDEDKGTVERTFNRLYRKIVDLNMGRDVPSPTAELIDETEINEKIAERDGTLTEKLRVRFKKSYVSKTYKIDEDDFELEGGEPKPADEPDGGPTPPKPPTPNPEDEDSPDFQSESFRVQEGIDKLVEASVQRMEFLSEDLQAAITQILKTSENYGEFIVRMATLKDKVDAPTFATMFGQSLDIASVAGLWAVNENQI